MGFAVFFTAYQVYSAFLGGIDGLTPLPSDYWPVAAGSEFPISSLPPVNLADRKLLQAFGEACVELRRNTKLEVRNRGLVLAVDEFKPIEGGRVQLKPFSAAIFGKPHPGENVPEINTIQSDVAFVEFDRPVSNITEMSNRKLVGAELGGSITIINNRRTVQRDDDLVMHTKGPMYYREDRHWIGTGEEVEVIDPQSKPEPTKITARGMDVYLTTDKNQPGSPASAARKPKPEGISGVERVVLCSTVRMVLFVDARSGFLAPSKPQGSGVGGQGAGGRIQGAGSKGLGSAISNQKSGIMGQGAGSSEQALTPDPRPLAPDKAKVVITTAGPFSYDVVNDRARFDIPPRPGRYPENVEVTRLHEQGKLDQLLCDHLDLQFHRKPNHGPQPSADNRSDTLEITSAHATGTQVTLTSDVEGLDAVGNDLFYDAQQRRSVLKGSPETVAMKDGNEIYARELWMVTNENKDGNEALAKGPGHISMLDRNGQRNTEARWRDQLVYKKEGAYDALTLTGEATFEDKLHQQRMRADRLKVLLVPGEPGAAPEKKEQQRARPHHVEAKGHVTAESSELRVKDPTDNLVLWFKDIPTKDSGIGNKESGVGDQGSGVRGKESEIAVQAPVGKGQESGIGASASDSQSLIPGSSPDKPKKPIELNARSVVVHVLRSDVKTELDNLTCEGIVHVHQEPASAEEKGIDIRGETLQLNRHIEGSLLIVNGTPGQVQFDKLTIMGPEVNIDQRANKAWVNGIGAMQMLTDSNLDGAKLAKPTELTVHWKESMLFNGKNAEFRGGIQAEQLNSRLLCEEMQVAFDRPISLKEGEKKGEPKPKVDKLLCDKSVQIEDVTRENGKLVGYKRLVGPVVSLDNEEQIVTAPGPGEVRLLQLGTSDESFPTPPTTSAVSKGTKSPPAKGAASITPQPAKGGRGAGGAGGHAGATPASKDQPNQELYLTHVRFSQRMQTFNKQRTAYFYGDVQVVHLPSDNPDLKIKIDPLPPRCIYLRCEKLEVFSHLLPNGQRNQELKAHKKVVVQAQEFWGLADVVKYDESLDRLIFEGSEGNPATLYRTRGQGAQQEKVSGKKILYWRKTNLYKIEDGQGINAVN
jgi:hypothetical protein